MKFTQVGQDGVRVFMGRLEGPDEIHTGLERVCKEESIKTATINLLGGLTEIEIRSFGINSLSRNPPVIINTPMEIVSGHGTVSINNNRPSIHLHLAVSYNDPDQPNNIAVVGGHVSRAKVYAIEFTLTAYDGRELNRVYDKATGLELWNF